MVLCFVALELWPGLGCSLRCRMEQELGALNRLYNLCCTVRASPQRPLYSTKSGSPKDKDMVSIPRLLRDSNNLVDKA